MTFIVSRPSSHILPSFFSWHLWAYVIIFLLLNINGKLLSQIFHRPSISYIVMFSIYLLNQEIGVIYCVNLCESSLFPHGNFIFPQSIDIEY